MNDAMIKKRNEYIVFVRTSIEDKYCRQSKNTSRKYKPKLAHRKLSRVYKKFKKLQLKPKSEKGCDNNDTSKCEFSGKYEWEIENLDAAIFF